MMIDIYICEDQKKQLEKLKKIINAYLFKENELPVKIACVSQDPDVILNEVQTSENTGLYFLDIDLKSHMNGIELAYEIRKYDPRGFIVFLTAHPEHMHSIFQYNLEVMDYILKGAQETIAGKIHACIKNAWIRHEALLSKNGQLIRVRHQDNTFYLDAQNIIYIETIKGSHKINIYTTDTIHECYMTLKEIRETLPEFFIQCHHSCLVNQKHITHIDRKKRIVYLTNDYTCDISQRMMKNLCSNEQPKPR